MNLNLSERNKRYREKLIDTAPIICTERALIWTEIFAENEAKLSSDSIRIDTHPDNKIMQGLVASLHYKYCGKVMYESVRLAYEKVLK